MSSEAGVDVKREAEENVPHRETRVESSVFSTEYATRRKEQKHLHTTLMSILQVLKKRRRNRLKWHCHSSLSSALRREKRRARNCHVQSKNERRSFQSDKDANDEDDVSDDDESDE